MSAQLFDREIITLVWIPGISGKQEPHYVIDGMHFNFIRSFIHFFLERFYVLSIQQSNNIPIIVPWNLLFIYVRVKKLQKSSVYNAI